MAVTIADLEINIQSTGNEMIATFTKLATKLNALSGHLDKATSSMKKVSKAMSDTGKEAKKAGEGAEKGAKGLGSFASSVLRIMKYRAIRAVLKTITQGFREGVQNIALYSAAMNEMDASKANNVMSAYASMGAQIKNSLGAAIMPLLANLLPAIQKVADMFMDAAEAVARFFATLNGQTTYTAANRNYWVDYAKNLNKATGAAKELKRTILGFDEINALNSQSSGGSGKTTPNYKDMFVEKTNDWFKLKDVFEGVLKVVKAIGIALAAWKVSMGIADFFGSFFRGWGNIRDTISSMLGGALMIGVGVYLSYEGGKSLAAGEIRKGLIETISGALTSALGGAIIGFKFGGGRGALLGASIGLTISLFTTLTTVLFSSDGYDPSKFREKTWDKGLAPILKRLGVTSSEFTSEGIKARVEVLTDLREKINSVSVEVPAETQAKLKTARKLIDDIFTLNNIPNKTSEQIEEIKFKIQTLNSLNLDGIHLEWNDLNGVVGATKETLEKTLEEMWKVAKQQAAMDAYKTAYANKLLADAQYASYQEHSKQLKEISKRTYELYKQGKATKEEVDAAKQAVLDYDLEVGKAANDAMRGANAVFDNVSKEIEKTWGDVTGKISNSTEDAANHIKNAFDPDKIIEPRKWKTAMINAFKGLPSIDFTVSNGKINPHVAGISAYATGGFVPSGDLFVAGEAGAELIMAAPNGSEVVNMAQFERAMMNAVSAAGGQGGDWTIVVQDENGSVKSRQVITAAERANRRDGRTVIPVGVY